MDRVYSFACYEEIGISIPNPKSLTRLSGPAEVMERIIAFALQNGIEVVDLQPGEYDKYIAMDLLSEA